MLRVQLKIEATFQWKDRAHGNGMRWHIWVEDSENEHIYHSETWLLTKKMMHEPAHTVAFTIPIFEPLPPQYYVRYSAGSVIMCMRTKLCVNANAETYSGFCDFLCTVSAGLMSQNCFDFALCT